MRRMYYGLEKLPGFCPKTCWSVLRQILWATYTGYIFQISCAEFLMPATTLKSKTNEVQFCWVFLTRSGVLKAKRVLVF